jgi:riboflavin kinase/FMN adenylyltransferase
MKIYNDINLLPIFKNAVITIGSFDGVNKGHLQIIKEMIEKAHEINGTSVLITFYPHPKEILTHHSNKIEVLNTLNEKSILLQQAGLDNMVVIPFDTKFSMMNPENYISDFLVNHFQPKVIIVGYDHKFGHERKGDFSLLKAHEQKFNYELIEIGPQILNDITISSTKIRNFIKKGMMNQANELLGYRYFFSGIVVAGNKIGRTIGFPTANISVTSENKLIPGDGVYAINARINDATTLFNGMMNIGYRPTVKGENKVIEVNIFDFDNDIYGKEVTIYIKEKIRDEITFTGIDMLKLQLEIDREVAALIK